MPIVSASKILDAPVVDVWGAIRDFGSHSRWIEHHPAISLVGGNGLTIGVKRRVTYGDGSFFDEILTAMDDRKWLQEYDVVGDLPLPVYNVTGAMQLYAHLSSGASAMTPRSPRKRQSPSRKAGSTFSRRASIFLPTFSNSTGAGRAT